MPVMVLVSMGLLAGQKYHSQRHEASQAPSFVTVLVLGAGRKAKYLRFKHREASKLEQVLTLRRQGRDLKSTMKLNLETQSVSFVCV